MWVDSPKPVFKPRRGFKAAEAPCRKHGNNGRSWEFGSGGQRQVRVVGMAEEDMVIGYPCDSLLWEREWNRGKAQKPVGLQQESEDLQASGSSPPKKPESPR